MTAAEQILDALKLVVGKDVNEYAIPVINTIIEKHESAQLSAKDKENERLTKENEYHRSENHPLRISNAAYASACDGFEKENQELRKRCEDLEAENGTMAESIGEFNELIEVFGKVWQAFPDEVLNDQLNEDYHQCSEFYDRYFEDEGHEF